MPAPQKSILSKLSKINFVSKNINLPINWDHPGDQYPDAFHESEKNVPPNPPMNLFQEPTLNKYHVDTARDIGKKFEDYIEGICSAICDGIDKWMKMTPIAGVIINGPVGTLFPGCVTGPPLMPLIFATAPKRTPQELKYSRAISNAIGTLWLPWHMGLAGTLMYPPFAAFPGPLAPPTPNVPLPLAAFSSPGETGLSPDSLKNMMEANLAEPTALHASDLFDSVSRAFNTIFQTFKTTTIVQNVLGTGPVPTFAPPVVPAGPVLAGTVIPVPGVLK